MTREEAAHLLVEVADLLNQLRRSDDFEVLTSGFTVLEKDSEGRLMYGSGIYLVSDDENNHFEVHEGVV